MKARAEMRLRDNSINFIVECKAHNVMEAMNKLKDQMSVEFDHSFEADKWATINIRIDRDGT